MAAQQLHIVGRLSAGFLRNQHFCLPSKWAKPSGIKPTTPAEFLASAPEDSRWRLPLAGRVLDISQWETPKRTRTYPLPRVYRLLQSPNRKVALIPV